MEKSHLHLEEKEGIKQKLISIYRDLQKFLQSEVYTKELQNELQQSNPDYLKVLEKRIRDMEKSDHGIVIAGETSAGKSTLINKILEKRIFKGRILESSSTICKIRNSERIKIVTECDTGEIEETDLTNKCELGSEKGVKVLRDSLKKVTDMTLSMKSIHHRSVDIGFPIPFLMGNVILVDTPGIGGSGKVTQKLMEYLPNALSFIFVINVASAGGMQSDRLPEILRSILLLQMDNEMPCFNPENVIFITNKWDSLNTNNTDEDSSDDDEETKVWENIKSNVKQRWPSVREENIFKMNLKDVSPQNDNSSTKQFKKFRTLLESSVKKAENIRVDQHIRFLQEILMNVSKGINARLELGKKSEKEQMELTKEHIKKINFLTDECRKVRDTLQKRIKKDIEGIAQGVYDYMSTDLGKDRILNPPGKPPIMEVEWHPQLFVMDINERINLHVVNVLKSSDIAQMFETVKKELASFYEKVSAALSDMENDWIEVGIDDTELSADTEVGGTNNSKASVVGVVLATSPLWLPLLAAGIGIVVAFVGLSIALSPVAIPLMKFLGRDARKRKIIDEEFNNRRNSVRSLICNELEVNCAGVMNKLIDKVTKDLLPKRIQALQKLIQQLSESRAEILENQELLEYLSKKQKDIEESLTELKICLTMQKGIS
ncbi:uncharacterized protein LOC128172979 [Crassostrea angulata]|uniref:uncharacterized protein LOC128172979 n=1 Tax=Magallana angulata TaxID=2784310 RepID=UPI0022B10408|nr:uncharacterized protein LOC128172979 [Crassostrea angulata]